MWLTCFGTTQSRKEENTAAFLRYCLSCSFRDKAKVWRRLAEPRTSDKQNKPFSKMLVGGLHPLHPHLTVINATCFFYSPIIRMWRRKSESCRCRQLSGDIRVHCISLAVLRKMWETRSGSASSSAGLSQDARMWRSSCSYAMTFRGKRRTQHLKIHVSVSCDADRIECVSVTAPVA